MMDVDDDALFVEWEDDTIFSNVSCLQSYHGNLRSDQRNQISSEQKNSYERIDNDLDYAIAVSLQMDYNDEVKENTNTASKTSEASKPLSIVNEQWELIDPHPDIHALFVEFDEKFFYGKLKSVEVRWSSRMTLCAGICSYQGKGGLCSIGLSEPLLKLRPRRDLVETLLHEMIHAYLFVTQNNKDRDGHGPEFLSHMYRINKVAGTRITVYHSYHAEVNLYKKHWWKCDGACRNRPPYFGLVKRVMNRAPGPNDNWWAAHQLSCGGKFIKIKEPDNFSEKKIPKRKLQSDSKSKPSDIRKFLKVGNLKNSNIGSSQLNVLGIESPAVCIKKTSPPMKDTLDVINRTEMSQKDFIPFQGIGHKLSSSSGALQVSSNFPSVNLKDLYFERKRDLSSSLYGNCESKGASISSSPGKALIKRNVSYPIEETLTKKDLLSSSPRKDMTKKILYPGFLGKKPNKRDSPSSLPGKFLAVIPLSRSVKNPRVSNAGRTQNLQKGFDISANASSNKTNKSDNAVKNNLLPQNNSDCLQESCDTDVNFSRIVSTKLYCPVCSNLVSEEINAHLDKCLKNLTVLTSSK